MKKTEIIAIRSSEEFKERLKKIAIRRRRSLSQMILVVLEDYVQADEQLSERLNVHQDQTEGQDYVSFQE